jgi:N-acetylglucosaminyl-diphospho-decaprenol L-rhamnosyltransferase
MANGDITAVVVAFNSAEVLPACLTAVSAAELAAVVVDNASVDSTIVVAEAAGARVLRNAHNEGFGRAMNQGVAAAATPYCLLLNPDVDFTPGAVRTLRAAMEAHPNALLAGPHLIEHDGRDGTLSTSPINPAVARTPASGARFVSLLSGAALLLRRDAFLALGGFDPNVFLFWEDNDLCRRAIDAGHDLLMVDAARMKHARGKSGRIVRGSIYRSRWHQAWSRFYAFRKYGVESDLQSWVWRFRIKYAFACLTNNRERMERYAGSRDGALAFQRGETALAKENLV